MERSRKSYVPSSRLSELPQRVADSNRMSMAYATPQSKSFGKLNIPKPPSVSSDRRTSFFGSRTSGAGMARNSIFGGAEKIKDVRPLHDKTFVQQCIRQLCEFLQEKGFPGAVTTKSLQSPSTKEFLKVFEFIYCLLDPTFHMPSSKVEEEVPRILKDLGYQFALSQSSMLPSEEVLNRQDAWAEMKLAEYHKLARQLKLIPASAENACGHDFTISPCTEQGPSSLVHYKTHIQNPLRKLIINVEEESSRLTNKKLTLEGAVDQVNSCISDKGNDLKQLREQIRRLDEKLENDSQELARDEQKWAAEMESVDNHKKLLEKNITQGYEESVEQLKAARQQYHLVRQETDEQRRTVAKNLASVFSTATDHLGIVEKYLEDQRKRVERVCSETLQEEEEELQNLHHIMDGFLDKAANMPS
ncbi:kinetochore protein NDC80 homolog [Osmerus eperlanus]|uniref:kinetochore protein NDC80 homolog n=1 Tax=Osmerus eperlanus TaxID=29151 RepID=UPI002E133E12